MLAHQSEGQAALVGQKSELVDEYALRSASRRNRVLLVTFAVEKALLLRPTGPSEMITA
jgi:hypothetical protein